MTGVNIVLLDEKKLSYLLVDGYWQVSVFDEIDSTQNYLKSRKVQHGDVVTAEYQSAGRGRLDRTFEAEKFLSLLFSFYIEPKKSREDWGWIPLIAGLAVTNVLNRSAQNFFTKWPNDVLALNSKSDGKVCGVLTETFNNGVIVGIGVNVHMDSSQLPVPTATSLSLVGISGCDRNELLADILKEFSRLCERWESGENFALEYEESSSTIGKKVEIQGSNGESQTGIATSIGSDGELILDHTKRIYSGDVIHLYT